jgi:hypothetical protein
MAKAVHTAAKAIDPGIIFLSPGFERLDAVEPYLTASDGAGGTGASITEAVGFHPYFAVYDSSTAVREPISLKDTTSRIRAAMTAAGLAPSIPLYITEIGIASGPDHPNITELTEFEQAAWILNVGLGAAVQGVRGIYFYCHDDVYVGNPSKSKVVAAAIGSLGRISGGELSKWERDNNGINRVTVDGVAIEL